MKKLLCIIACITFVLSLTSGATVAQASGTTPTISVDSVEAKAGDTVDVAVYINNNPGTAYLELTPTIDAGITITKVTNGSIFSDLTEGKQYVWASNENVTKDGKLATITYKVDPAACSGDYLIGFTVRGIYNYDEEEVNFEIVQGKIVVSGEDNFATAGLNIGSSLTLNTTVVVPESVKSPKMKCTLDEKSITIDGVYSDGAWTFRFENITPQHMSDIYKMEILDGDKVILKKNYSVKDYCDTLYKMTAEELSMTQTDKNNLDTFLANMLEYGAMSQIYLGNNLQNLANSLDWVAGKKTATFAKPESNKATTVAAKSSDDKIVSASVWLNDYIEPVFSINAKTATTVVINDGTKDVEYDISSLSMNNGSYILSYGKLKALELDKNFTVTLKAGNEILHQVTYSVNSYVASKCNDTNNKLANLVKSIYNYGVSAKALK